MEIEIFITKKLAELAREEDWSGGEVYATALALSAKVQGVDIEDIEISIGVNPGARKKHLRGGYTARPVPHWETLDTRALGYAR